MWVPPFGFCPPLEPKGGTPRALFAAKKNKVRLEAREVTASLARPCLPLVHAANGLAQVEKTPATDKQPARLWVGAGFEAGSLIVVMEIQLSDGL